MAAGIWNTLFGLALLGAGATGRLSLPLVDSPVATMVAGGLMTLWGISQLWRSRKD